MSIALVGQYTIGGVLAFFSFVRQSLSAHIIGIFGVLVLLSSLIRQRYRSDQRSRTRHGIFSLRTLIREVEDDLLHLRTARKMRLQFTRFDKGLVGSYLRSRKRNSLIPGATIPHNKLDASGGSVFLNLFGAAKGALMRAAASTPPLATASNLWPSSSRPRFITLQRQWH